MWYEINVSKDGKHYFATHKRSIKVESVNNFFSRSTQEYYVLRNPKYTLLTLDDEEIGNWKTFASLKKNAKDRVKRMGL